MWIFSYQCSTYYCNLRLEFGNVRQPLLIRGIRSKFSVQNIFSDELWLISLLRAAFICILDGGLNSKLTADAKNYLVVHINVMIALQVIADSTITFIRTFHVNLLNFACNSSVFRFRLRHFVM